MSAKSVFPVKFTLQFTSLAIFFFLKRMSFKRKQAHPQRANEKGKKKAISESNVNRQRIWNHAKIKRHKNNFVSSRSKKSFTDVLYSTLSLETRSFTF